MNKATCPWITGRLGSPDLEEGRSRAPTLGVTTLPPSIPAGSERPLKPTQGCFAAL